MKHVFFIHSHITWLVSLGVIRHRALDASDVLLVCTRGYVPPEPGLATMVFPDRRWVITWRLRQWWRQQRDLARFVDAVAGGREFAWYLPHTAFPFFRAFARHRLCRGFHLIEEGMAAYHRPEAIDRILSKVVSSRRGWRGWIARALVKIRPPVFADPRYIAAYASTDEAFPGYARRERIRIEGPAPAGAGEIETVLVFDGVLEAQMADEAPLHACLQELVARLAEDGRRTVHYKLSPQQYIDQRYSPRLKQAVHGNPYGIQFVELPANYSLELLAIAGRADFFVFLSSVGIYAAEAGCRVYSMSRRLAELDGRYRSIVDAIPDGVRKKLLFL